MDLIWSWVKKKCAYLYHPQTTVKPCFHTPVCIVIIQNLWILDTINKWHYHNAICSLVSGNNACHYKSSRGVTGIFREYCSLSQEICTRFCCALLCCGYAIVHNELAWSIYPYSSGCFAGIGAIVRLPQCQWSKPDGYGKISQCITTTKHSKAKTVCIFLGIYCRSIQSPLVSPEHQRPFTNCVG